MSNVNRFLAEVCLSTPSCFLECIYMRFYICFDSHIDCQWACLFELLFCWCFLIFIMFFLSFVVVFAWYIFVCILRLCAGVVFEIATHSPLHSFVCLFFSPLSAFQWRKGLKLSGEAAVEKITLDGVRGLRVMLSATVHDVLYYMSPVYCQDITNSVWVIPKNLWNSLSFHFPFLFLFDVSTHCSSLSVFSSIENCFYRFSGT